MDLKMAGRVLKMARGHQDGSAGNDDCSLVPRTYLKGKGETNSKNCLLTPHTWHGTSMYVHKAYTQQ